MPSPLRQLQRGRQSTRSGVDLLPEMEWDHYTRFGVVFRGLRVRMAVATGVTDLLQIHPVSVLHALPAHPAGAPPLVT